jgi:CRISPR-associated endonuclease/helicase Cas3
MEPAAHSARPEKNIGVQSYHDHVTNVVKKASYNANRACCYLKGNGQEFKQSVIDAAVCHDLGKLDTKNQKILTSGSKKSLPVKHEDAGSAYLIKNELVPAAILAGRHHAGLPNLYEEKKKGKLFLRDEEVFSRTEKYLGNYVSEHNQFIKNQSLPPKKIKNTENWNWNGLRFRLALSCLVDADHSDTACHYENENLCISPHRRWKERLNRLESYVESLFKKAPYNDRNILRRDIFHGCKNAALNQGIVACDSPVGTGKTTAVMAYLLKAAIEKKLRHIFVVLPYTNIIKQSVETYRKALVLPGEDESAIIAEHHHQADFEHLNTRHLATRWKSPIIVTTAVQFFETIAACQPTILRKFHELPGSAVFIDEVHSAIPSWLWPQMWIWVKELVADWSCHFVMASGSLPKFWKFPQISKSSENVPEIVPERIRRVANSAELIRIEYRTVSKPLVLSELTELILSSIGPRLVIMNTVQSAAVVAKELYSLSDKVGGSVLHLSTALCPADRDNVVSWIEKRLEDKNDLSWTLVATSCVEAGMDFSFASAFRERCSTSSLIQIGGRANRHADKYRAKIWDFCIDTNESLLNQHPAFRVSRMVLNELFIENKMNNLSSMELATEAMRREIMSGYDRKAERIKDKERKYDYPEVAKLCRVIASDTRIVIVSPDIVQALKQKAKIHYTVLLRNSVQLWPQKIEYLSIEELLSYPGLYKMPEGYYDGANDDSRPCFGYMKGLLPLVYAQRDGLVI